MGVGILLAISTVWGTVDYGMPWLVEQQIRLDQPNQLSQEEHEAIELRVEDRLMNHNYREIKVIVIPIGEETKRERLVITK